MTTSSRKNQKGQNTMEKEDLVPKVARDGPKNAVNATIAYKWKLLNRYSSG